MPAAIYAYFNAGTLQVRGWAIPSATDIAFSLGVLALFGRRVPMGLKIFLMALAVIDDLAAIVIIAVFYASELSLWPLLGAAFSALILYLFNRRNVQSLWPYLLMGVALWLGVLLSGVHATVAGVILGLIIPLGCGRRLLHCLHPWVAYGIMPIFTFANAGVALGGLSVSQLTQPVTLGIISGLVIGKPLGIFGASWLLIRLKLAQLPHLVSSTQLFAVASLAGIGFTMNLFIGQLALADEESQLAIRLGVMAGSFISALLGAALMALALKAKK